MEPLDALRAAYADSTGAAKRRQGNGQKIIGYMCDSVPVELIEAAGAYPLRITGYPAPGAAVLDRYLYSLLPKGFWQVRQSSLEFVNHMFGRLVDGTYAMLDAVVIPNTRKPLLNMVTQLRNAANADPALKLPKLFLIDRAATRVDSAHAFNNESIRKFRTDLSEWIGAPIRDGAIEEAIGRRRERSRSLRRIMDWRRMDPPGISGTDVLAIIGSAMFIAADEHDALVGQVLGAGPQPVAAGIRVFIGGSPPDNDLLYRIVESMGATVVGEDHCWGERFVEFGEVDEPDPMGLLMQRWHCSASCGFRLPLEATLRNVVERAKAARAEAVILNVFREDEMQIWDTPSQVRALEQAGIPVLHLTWQPHVITDDSALRARLDGFLSALSVEAA